MSHGATLSALESRMDVSAPLALASGSPLRLLDLFCGVGGWSKCFAARGWKCVGVDIAELGYPPVWLTVDEMRRVLSLASGTHQLMLQLTYGCGMRLMECVRLRVKDVDLERRVVTIRGAKGDKDRAVGLPESLRGVFGDHLQRVRSLWEGDRAQGRPPVQLPGTLERKYPTAGSEWAWFWAFPGRNLSQDPRSGIVRRHHTHEDGFSKALRSAVRRAGISKRVTMHVLRHSYATHQLERGVPLHKLRDLLGHNDISTTEIYLHVLPKEVAGVGSPLDDLAGGNVLAFPLRAQISRESVTA
jgi:integron integrase